jgi:hemoglobin
MPTKSDTATPEDVDKLVAAFYDRLLLDNLLGPIFQYIAKIDLKHHLPIIAAFWKDILLNTGNYKRNAFEPHRLLNDKIPLTEAHFARWLKHFNETVDTLYQGPMANTAKQRAQQIAQTMQNKLGK